MILTVKASIEVPRIPNYLRIAGGQTVPLYACSDDDLRELARLMGEAMVARAAEQRAHDKETL